MGILHLTTNGGADGVQGECRDVGRGALGAPTTAFAHRDVGRPHRQVRSIGTSLRVGLPLEVYWADGE